MVRKLIKMEVKIAKNLAEHLGEAFIEAGREGTDTHCRILTENLRAGKYAGTRLEKSITYGIDPIEDGWQGHIDMLKYGKVLEFGSPGRNLSGNMWITNVINSSEAGIASEWERIILKHLQAADRKLPRVKRD